MKTTILKTTETYPSFVLIETTNNFDDQVLHIEFENKQGVKKYVWTEINREGNHRNVDTEFVTRMKALVELDGPEIEKIWEGK